MWYGIGEDDSRLREVSAITMDIGKRIREAREEYGMSGVVLARRAGVTPAHLNMIEHGSRTPSLGLLEKIAKELRTEPAEFLREPALPLANASETGRGLGRNQDELAALLRRGGAPTQYLAEPGLVDTLKGLDDAAFYAIIHDLDTELEVLAPEIRRLRLAAAPGSDSYIKVMRLWDKTGNLFLALKMLVRARQGVEPQSEQLKELKEVADISREMRELAGELVGVGA